MTELSTGDGMARRQPLALEPAAHAVVTFPDPSLPVEEAGTTQTAPVRGWIAENRHRDDAVEAFDTRAIQRCCRVAWADGGLIPSGAHRRALPASMPQREVDAPRVPSLS